MVTVVLDKWFPLQSVVHGLLGDGGVQHHEAQHEGVQQLAEPGLHLGASLSELGFSLPSRASTLRLYPKVKRERIVGEHFRRCCEASQDSALFSREGRANIESGAPCSCRGAGFADAERARERQGDTHREIIWTGSMRRERERESRGRHLAHKSFGLAPYRSPSLARG